MRRDEAQLADGHSKRISDGVVHLGAGLNRRMGYTENKRSKKAVRPAFVSCC
jgi:hypothetical protein